jgi:Fur family ferric uptake transcriptional regulator
MTEHPESVEVPGNQQRQALLRSLAANSRFRSAQQIYADLQASGEEIGLTTVYRHLQRLADDGAIHAVQMTDRQTAYRQCSRTPHHHLICTNCGECVEFSDSDLDRKVETEAIRQGFVETSHSVEVFGLCGACVEHGQHEMS